MRFVESPESPILMKVASVRVNYYEPLNADEATPEF